MQRGVESITFCRYRTWVPQRHSGTGRTLFSSPITDRHRAGAQRQWDVCWTEYQCCIVWFPCQPVCKNNKKKKKLEHTILNFHPFFKRMNTTTPSFVLSSDTSMIHCILGAEGWELRTTWGHGAANMPIYVQFFSESTRNSPPKGHLCSAVSQEGFNSWITRKLEPRLWLFWGNSKYGQGYLFFLCWTSICELTDMAFIRYV